MNAPRRGHTAIHRHLYSGYLSLSPSLSTLSNAGPDRTSTCLLEIKAIPSSHWLETTSCACARARARTHTTLSHPVLSGFRSRRPSPHHLTPHNLIPPTTLHSDGQVTRSIRPTFCQPHVATLLSRAPFAINIVNLISPLITYPPIWSHLDFSLVC